MRFKPWHAAAAVAVLAISATGTAPESRAALGTTAIRTVVPTDLETTWNILLAELEEGDLTINATIREKSTIRVLLQSKIPSTWVDCGTITVHSQHEIFGDRTYSFAAANSVRYMVAHEELNELIDVERRTSLNALATVKLAPAGEGTLVDVSADYVMKIRTREFGEKIDARSIDDNIHFDSAGQASLTEEIREGADMKSVTVACRPTGELERRIVAALGTPSS